MPIYEYRCGSCGLEKEYLQKVSDVPMKTCPQCGKDTLSKLVSAAGFHLKGSGWYATDFKGNGKAKEAGGKPAPAKGSEAAPKEGTAESKAETKSESTDTKPAADSGSHGCGGCSCA